MFKKWRLNRLLVKIKGQKTKVEFLAKAASASESSYYMDKLVVAATELAKMDEKLDQLTD